MFSGISCTKTCSLRVGIRFHKKIFLVDTPGIFDTQEPNDEIQQEIFKCINLSSPGPHAFILVLNITTRFTKDEEQTVQHFVKYFGEEIYKYLIVLFTRKEELDRRNLSLKQYIENSGQSLKSFIEKCGGRAFAMENTLQGDTLDEQVRELLNMILRNVENNRGDYYTNAIYEKAEREIRRIEDMRWQANMKRREEKFHAIEEKIVKRYQQKSDEEKEKLKKVRNQLRELKENREKNREKIDALTREIKEQELLLNESQSDTNDDFHITLDGLRNQLADRKTEEYEDSLKIDELTNIRNETLERIENKLHEMCRNEIENEYEKFNELQRAEERDTIREQAATWNGEMLGKALKTGYEILTLLLPKL